MYWMRVRTVSDGTVFGPEPFVFTPLELIAPETVLIDYAMFNQGLEQIGPQEEPPEEFDAEV